MTFKNRLKVGLAFFRIFRAAISSYFKEFSYFFSAKIPYIVGDFSAMDQQEIMVRKRTHHLERVVWHPLKYPKEVGQQAYRDLEELLSLKAGKMDPKQEGWAKRISREFKRGGGGAETFCPVLSHEVARPPAAVKPPELMALIKQRRSRRVFETVPLTDEEKSWITDAAQHAPSSCNRQTIEIIFVDDQGLKDFVAASIPGGYQFFAAAPSIAIFLSDARDYKYPEDRNVPYIDAAAAVQNVYLLCETLGLGCCWGSYTSFGSIFREAEVRRRLRIPNTHLIVASLAIGKSNQHVCDIPRDNPVLRFGTDGFKVRNATKDV